jgi:hypothetical protein
VFYPSYRKLELGYEFDVCGSVHHSTIHKENPTRCNNVSNFNIPNLYEAQHVSGDKPPIIRSLKLHWQPLVLHTWKVPDNIHQPSMYSKPEAASAVLDS